MDKKYPLASTSEQEIIIKTLIDLINEFPDLPQIVKSKGLIFYDMLPNAECMGLATINSAIILQKYIGGSYIGQYNFRLQYRYSTKNYNERIQKQSLLSTIGEWLEKKKITRIDGSNFSLENYPEISTNKTIIEIEITDRTILIDKNKTGYEDSLIDLRLTYHVGKDDL